MKFLLLAVVLIVIEYSCGKNNNDGPPLPILVDVSCQQYTDILGNDLASSGTCPSVIDTAFSEQEVALFNSLDTVDLSGTMMPTSAGSQLLYPNPFRISSGFTIQYYLPNQFLGQIIAKYVITDSLLHPVYKTAKRLDFNQTIIAHLQPPVEALRLRLFYTLSDQFHNPFLRGWINITAIK